jgi:hypothetical protein
MNLPLGEISTYSLFPRYFLTSGYFEGFKIYVHNPSDFPEVHSKGFLLAPGTAMYASVGATGDSTNIALALSSLSIN